MKYTLASSTWDEKELQAIQDVIKSDMFTMGKKVAEFEKDFAKFTGSRYAVMTSSGSAANLIATAALFYTKNPKLTRGDEVIVPAVSWSTTYYPFYQYGLKLKFVDIDLETLNYNLDALSSAISDRTKMIMIVNLLGNPNDFDAINNLIKGKILSCLKIIVNQWVQSIRESKLELLVLWELFQHSFLTIWPQWKVVLLSQMMRSCIIFCYV